MSIKPVNSNTSGAISLQEPDAEKLNRALARVPCRFVEGFASEDGGIDHDRMPFIVMRIINVQPNSPDAQVKEDLLVNSRLFSQVNNHPVAQKRGNRDQQQEWVRYSASWQFGWGDHYLRHYIGYESEHFFHREILDLLREQNRVGNTIVLAESILSDRFPTPVLKIVLGYFDKASFPSREEQCSAERMKQVRIALFTSFTMRPVPIKPEKQSPYVFLREAPETTAVKRITEITAQFLDGTGIDETSPKQMALAADQGFELPLHLQILHVSSREDGMSALQYARTPSGARELILAGAEPDELEENSVDLLT